MNDNKCQNYREGSGDLINLSKLSENWLDGSNGNIVKITLFELVLHKIVQFFI